MADWSGYSNAAAGSAAGAAAAAREADECLI